MNVLTEISDKVLLKLAQSVNNFLDADSSLRYKTASFFGLVVTLVSLHNLESRLRNSLNDAAVLRPLFVIIILALTFLGLYLLVAKLLVGSSRIGFNNFNCLLGLVSCLFFYVFYIQILKVFIFK